MVYTGYELYQSFQTSVDSENQLNEKYFPNIPSGGNLQINPQTGNYYAFDRMYPPPEYYQQHYDIQKKLVTDIAKDVLIPGPDYAAEKLLQCP